MTVFQFNLIEGLPSYSVYATLDGVTYNFTFRYSYFQDSWFLGIPGEIDNLKITNGVDLLKQYKYKNVPQGELKTVRLAGRKSKPSYQNFGANKEIALVYYPVT